MIDFTLVRPRGKDETDHTVQSQASLLYALYSPVCNLQ